MTRAPLIALLAPAAVASLCARSLAAPSDHPAAKDLVIVGDPPPECYVEDGKQSKAWFETIHWNLREGELGDVLKALSKIDCRRYLVPKSLLHEKVTLFSVDAAPGARRFVESSVLSKLREAGFQQLESMPLITRKPAAAEADPLAPAPPIPDEELDKAIHCADSGCTITRALADQVLHDGMLLATSARIVPSIHDGKPDGFKLYATRPRSFFGRIGFQNGDTIHTINGMDVSTPDKMLEVYTKARSTKSWVVEGTRRGQPFKLELVVQ